MTIAVDTVDFGDSVRATRLVAVEEKWMKNEFVK